MKIYFLPILLSLILLACTKTVKTNHDDGSIKEEYEVNKDGQKHGVYKRYYPEGVLAETSHFVNGVENGERKIYFPNGNLEYSLTNKNGLVEGKKMVYYDTGELLIDSEYKESKVVGKFIKYYKNGNIIEEVTFVDDLENGPFKEYYEDGTIKWKGQYLNGDNEFGIIESYDKSGQLIKKLECDSTKLCKTIWTLEKGDIIE